MKNRLCGFSHGCWCWSLTGKGKDSLSTARTLEHRLARAGTNPQQQPVTHYTASLRSAIPFFHPKQGWETPGKAPAPTVLHRGELRGYIRCSQVLMDMATAQWAVQGPRAGWKSRLWSVGWGMDQLQQVFHTHFPWRLRINSAWANSPFFDIPAPQAFKL